MSLVPCEKVGTVPGTVQDVQRLLYLTHCIFVTFDPIELSNSGSVLSCPTFEHSKNKINPTILSKIVQM